MKLILQNCRIIDPSQKIDTNGNIVIDKGVIKGLPNKGLIFFFGKPLDPPLAKTKANTFFTSTPLAL